MARQRWEEWNDNEDRLAVLSAWARAGLSDERIAKEIGISRSTLSEWKRKHERIREALQTGKEIANRQVENKLFGMTQGGIVKVRKAFKLKRTEYDHSGKKTKEEEYLDTAEEDIYIEPDIKAIIFWLKNRMPEEWREKVLIEEREGGNGEALVIINPKVSKVIKEEMEREEKERS